MKCHFLMNLEEIAINYKNITAKFIIVIELWLFV